jgi:hypothetical protein
VAACTGARNTPYTAANGRQGEATAPTLPPSVAVHGPSQRLPAKCAMQHTTHRHRMTWRGVARQINPRPLQRACTCRWCPDALRPATALQASSDTTWCHRSTPKHPRHMSQHMSQHTHAGQARNRCCSRRRTGTRPSCCCCSAAGRCSACGKHWRAPLANNHQPWGRPRRTRACQHSRHSSCPHTSTRADKQTSTLTSRHAHSGWMQRRTLTCAAAPRHAAAQIQSKV